MSTKPLIDYSEHQAPLVYSYDRLTGAYCGCEYAVGSPSIIDRQSDTPVWLQPAWSTLIHPGMPAEGCYRAFNPTTEEWFDVPIPEAASDESEVVEDQPLERSTKEKVDSERDYRLSAGFVFDGVVYQCSADDTANIAGAATAAVFAVISGAEAGDLRWHGGDTDFRWIALDNSTHVMDAQTVIAFARAAMARKEAFYFAGFNLKALPTLPEDYRDDKYWPPTIGVLMQQLSDARVILPMEEHVPTPGEDAPQ